MRILRLIPSLIFIALSIDCWAASNPIVLHGTVKGDQNNSYIEAPFDVPPGTERLTVSFRYTGKEEHTTLDIGIEDPQRFRGWSGGNKSTFTIGTSDATPSYLPGPVVPGKWKLLIGVPNIRPSSVATYEAEIYLSPAGTLGAFSGEPLRSGWGWYRGDLHMHTAHSDGQCNSQSGKRIPCPVFFTADAAARRGLDFIAVTDHNTTAHYDALRELQPYFDKLLLIPGREITTFTGHANVFGAAEFLDFRVGSSSVPDMNSLLHNARDLNALVSINHPGAPTGEICMGCGWTPRTTADFNLVTAVEAVNGGSEEGPYSGVPFWETQLTAGYRLTAIGGSDNHNAQLPPERPGSVGSPTTVVYAPELSVQGILDGIRSGRVFVDLTASNDRLLDLSARSATGEAFMGGSLGASAGETVELSAHVLSCRGAKLRIVIDGNDSGISPQPIPSADETLHATWKSDGQRHWLRADVLSDAGKLQVLGNAIYVNWIVDLGPVTN